MSAPTKICSACGGQNAPTATTCFHCGAAFSADAGFPGASFTGASNEGTPVVVVNFDMPFGSMVSFMVKWALASIPAIIILGLVGAAVLLALGTLGSALRH